MPEVKLKRKRCTKLVFSTTRSDAANKKLNDLQLKNQHHACNSTTITRS